MRSASWTPVTDPSAVLTVIAVRLRLRAGAEPVALTPWTDRLRAEFERTPDLVGYALRMTAGVLWVVSAWTRRASPSAFESGPVHTAAEQELRGLLHPPVVDVWRAAPADTPPRWTDVRSRLRAAGNRTRSRWEGP